MKVKVENGKMTVESAYSKKFVKRARELGGKWIAPCWVFLAEDEEFVRQALMDVYGEDGSYHESVTVDLDLDHYEYGDVLLLDSVEIACRITRDGRVVMAKGATVISGGFLESGGSRSKPAVTHEAGTIVRIKDVPIALYDRIKDKPGVLLVQKVCDRKAQLEKERDKILERLEEIKVELGKL